MSKTVIFIGPQGLAATLAAMQAPQPAEERMSFVCEPPVGEDHSVAAMLQGLRDARAERTAADYSMADVNAAFDRIFGEGASDVPLCGQVMIDVELPEISFDEEELFDLIYGTDHVGPEFPGLHSLFGMTDEEYAEAEAEEEEQIAYAHAHDALMRMLDVFSQVSGHPVTTEQRVAMTLLLSNDDTAEAFATAAEDLLNSGLFE